MNDVLLWVYWGGERGDRVLNKFTGMKNNTSTNIVFKNVLRFFTDMNHLSKLSSNSCEKIDGRTHGPKLQIWMRMCNSYKIIMVRLWWI